ncbi:MAG: serine/threonine-protein kinase [Nannocystaceae bacterium]|nr:serine/threonine-protein kinase [Nannocystaceae bacterium]
MSGNDETLPMLEAERDQPLGPGQLFGRYLIVQRVGAGGVGEVYSAYDPSLDRRVALKVLRSSPDEDATTASDRQASLVREAKALASLSHPNVVTVHDVGRELERTYIAMELVEGRDLKEWIRESPDRPWRDTLRLFIDAGKGLHAAHAKDILHRDFKPANVLVGHDGWVRVSDFGLARLLSPTEVTARDSTTQDQSIDTSVSIDGRMVGTPYYMAPEQLDGDTTVCSDVYAFCLALHDALYRVRGFEGGSLMELAVRKAHGPPPVPSETRGVPSAVRSVLERGLQPTPDARWPSMAPLLAELEKALRPRSRATIPWLLGIGGIALTAAAMAPGDTGACSGASEALRPVWNEAQAAAVAEGIEGTRSPLAARASRHASSELERHVEAWKTAHTRVCEATRRGEQSATLLDQRMTCLQRQLLDFSAATEVLSSADATVVERTAQIIGGLPHATACETLSIDAEAREQSAESDAARAELAQINARIAAGLYPAADKRSAALFEATTTIDAPRLRSDVLFTRGNVLLKMGKIEDSVDMLERAAFAAVKSGYARGQMRAGALLVLVEGRRAARPEAGLRWARFAEAALVKAGGGALARSNIASKLASVYSEKGDHQAAELQLRRALELLERTDAPPERRAGLLDNLGSTARTLGRFDEAVQLHEEALMVREAVLGPEHPLLARSLTNTAAAYIELAKFEEADVRYARALQIREQALGPEHLDVATTAMNIGVSYYRRGNLKEARPYFERSLKIRQAALPEDHPRVLGTMANLAQLRSEAGDLEAAGALFDEVLRRLETRPDHDPRTKANTLANLAGLRVAQGRFDDALRLYESSLEIDEAQFGPDHPNVAMTLSNLGNVFESLERFDEALASQQRALKIREAKLGPQHPDLIWTLAGLSGVYQASGKPALAVPVLERALKIAEQNDPHPTLIAGVKFDLAQALDATDGDRARALALGQEALVFYRTTEGREDDLANIEAFVTGLQR